ncbi:DUF4386 domain-containing protein [Reichenbachiella sp.]
MTPRTLSKLTGASYLVIFFAAIFANFFVLEAILQDPIGTIQQNHQMVRFGILAFMITVVFDVVVAWTLNELFKGHILIKLSTYFRMMHAAIMGIAIFALPMALEMNSSEAILKQIDIFNTIWLIGLFFFGIHLLLLSMILQRPKWIALFLTLAGLMYMVDTSAHFLMADYDAYADVFLTLVAIPSMVGEMSLAIWLLVKGGRVL